MRISHNSSCACLRQGGKKNPASVVRCARGAGLWLRLKRFSVFEYEVGAVVGCVDDYGVGAVDLAREDVF